MWMFLALAFYVGVIVFAWSVAIDTSRRERAERIAWSEYRRGLQRNDDPHFDHLDDIDYYDDEH